MNSIEKQLNDIMNEIKNEVEGFVSFEELFDLGFMDKNSSFNTFDDFLK